MATLAWPPELTLKSLMFTLLPRTLVPKNRGNLPRCPLWFFFPRWMVKFAHKDVEVQKDLNTWKKNKMVRRLAIPKSHWSNIERKSSTYLGQQHICSAFWNYEQQTWFLKRHLTNLPPTFNNFSLPASIFLVSKHFAKPFCLSTWASSCAKWWPLALLDIVNRQDNIPPTGKCREPCKYRDKIHVKRWVGFWSNSARNLEVRRFRHWRAPGEDATTTPASPSLSQPSTRLWASYRALTNSNIKLLFWAPNSSFQWHLLIHFNSSQLSHRFQISKIGQRWKTV